MNAATKPSIHGETELLNRIVCEILDRHPRVATIRRLGGSNVGDSIQWEVEFARGRFTDAAWQAVRAEILAIRLAHNVQHGYVRYLGR